VLRVERVLQADGKSRTAKGGEAFAGTRRGNTPLGFVDGRPRKLFQSIYSIEIEQLAALGAGVQEHVDDLLLPEAQSLGLHPISKIRDRLAEEYERLWRPTRRGHQRVRELAERLATARKRAGEAMREEQGLRDALAEKARLEARLAADREKKAHLERVDRDAPYRRDLFELFRRQQRLGDPVDLSELGDLPLVEPATIERTIEQIEKDLAEPRTRLERESVALTDGQLAVIDAAAEIGFILNSEAEHATAVRRCEEEEARARELREDAKRSLGGALTREAGTGDLDSVAALPLVQLRSAQASWARALEQHLATSAHETRRAPLWTLVIVAAGVVGATAAELTGMGTFGVLIGIGVTAAAAIAAVFARAAPRRERRNPPPRPVRADQILEGLRIVTAFFASPTELLRLIEVLETAQRMLVDAARSEAEAGRLQRETLERERAWGAMCARHGLDAKGEGALLIGRLREALEGAREAEKRVEQDINERRQAESAVQTGEPALVRQRTHLETLRRTLRRAEPDAPSLEEAYRRVQMRLQEQHVVREWEHKLATDPRWVTYLDDPGVRDEGAAERADWLEEIAASRKEALEEVNADIDAANERLGALRSQLQEDEGSHSARALDAVFALEEELAEVKRERDRLALLDSILERAEREFREEHQPDVLQRASRHLARVTSGRYQRLYYLEGENGGLHVACVDRSEPVRVEPPISRGTLDQIFLCLRLGLLDHLDRDREKLPLILDDALLRMDDARRPQVYALLADIAPARQVFLLTCHAAIADEAEEALGASRIDLSPE
jgi:uncharacterized protein YhaN